MIELENYDLGLDLRDNRRNSVQNNKKKSKETKWIQIGKYEVKES